MEDQIVIAGCLKRLLTSSLVAQRALSNLHAPTGS